MAASEPTFGVGAFAPARVDGLVPWQVPGTQLLGAARSDWPRRLSRILMRLDLFVAAAISLTVFAVVVDEPGVGAAVIAVAFPIVWVLACMSTRAYETRFLADGAAEFRRVAEAGFRLLALCALAIFAFQSDKAAEAALIAFPVTVSATLLARYAARQIVYRQRVQGRWLHKVVVVGRERACAELIRQLRREPFGGFVVVGVCVDSAQSVDVEGIPVVGSSMSIVEALKRTSADTVAVGAWSNLSQQDMRRLAWQLEGTGVDLVVAPSLTDVAESRLHIRPISGLPLLHVKQPEFVGGRRIVKRVIDRVTALCLLVGISPLLLLFIAAIRLTSDGPAIFRQTRVGADGRTFTMYKFRSMYLDAEERLAEMQSENEKSDGLLFKIKADPRITPFGRLLRRFSIDELPQLFNVVRGDMSLVGPRPPLVREVREYGEDVWRRLLVPPGVTGLWQISGRSDLSWEESVRLDLHYVENWSLALDLAILWKTISAVLARRGAY